MKTRLLAIVGLLCVLGSPLAASADTEPPTISSGTPELYMSFMSGIGMTRSADATFTDGTKPTIIEDVDYRNNFVVGGNAGVWFPTRDKLWGFDLGMELTGFLWQADVAFGRNFYNQNPLTTPPAGTTTEIQALYIGPNFLIRYPLAVSEAYPNGRWFPYLGLGVGMHQMAMRPGGTHGISVIGTCCVPGGNLNTNAIPDQRVTTYGWLVMGGVKAHLFKYLAGFVEAKYIMAHHDNLVTDRYGQSSGGDAFPTFPPPPTGSTIFFNEYSSSINSIHVHAGLSIHFDIKP
jgi:opacity protein-like surface antigen